MSHACLATLSGEIKFVSQVTQVTFYMTPMMQISVVNCHNIPTAGNSQMMQMVQILRASTHPNLPEAPNALLCSLEARCPIATPSSEIMQ